MMEREAVTCVEMRGSGRATTTMSSGQDSFSVTYFSFFRYHPQFVSSFFLLFSRVIRWGKIGIEPLAAAGENRWSRLGQSMSSSAHILFPIISVFPLSDIWETKKGKL